MLFFEQFGDVRIDFNRPAFGDVFVKATVLNVLAAMRAGRTARHTVLDAITGVANTVANGEAGWRVKHFLFLLVLVSLFAI